MNPPHALSLRNLRKTYPGGFEALKGIDLDVAAGDFFALLGPNGAGKSTTIGIVSSLVNATSGSVSIFGVDLYKQRDRAKRFIGLVPQEINFNQFETVQNILLNQAGYYGVPRRQALQRAELCLKQMDLWDKRNTVSRRLSGGMKRRLMIARAMVHHPKLLILDEPTAGVDIEIRRAMWQLLKELNAQGTTIILTTHYLEEAENLCRHLAIIHHGRIVEQADLTSLLAKLQVDHFLLDLAQNIAPPSIPGYTINPVGERCWEVAVPKQLGLNLLFSGLSQHHIEVVSLKNKSNRLEQLLLDIIEQPGSPAL